MKKILVVEDDPAYLKVLKHQLTQSGFEVIEAEDGEEGLASANTYHPDLILLDIRMPVMNGMTMLDELRKDAYGKSVKVIILTNIEPDDEILEKVLRDIPTYYFIKSDTELVILIEKIKDLFRPHSDKE